MLKPFGKNNKELTDDSEKIRLAVGIYANVSHSFIRSMRVNPFTGYKRGEQITLLSDGRAVSKLRLWSVRLLLAVYVLIQLPRVLLTAESGAGLLGRFIGLTFMVVVIYWFALRLLSNDTEAIPDSDLPDLKSDTPADRGVVDVLSRENVTTRREIIRDAFEPGEYEDESEWWDEYARPELLNHPDVEQLDATGRRWEYLGDE